MLFLLKTKYVPILTLPNLFFKVLYTTGMSQKGTCLTLIVDLKYGIPVGVRDKFLRQVCLFDKLSVWPGQAYFGLP